MEQHTKHHGLHHGACGVTRRRANLDGPCDDSYGSLSKVRAHRSRLRQDDKRITVHRGRVTGDRLVGLDYCELLISVPPAGAP